MYGQFAQLIDLGFEPGVVAKTGLQFGQRRLGGLAVALGGQLAQLARGFGKRTLEALTEAGLVEAHGNTRGRSYTLSAAVYSVVSDKAAYTRQVGFGPIQHEQMVLSYIRQHGQIKRAEVMALCRLTEGQAKELLRRLVVASKIELHGAGRGATYFESIHSDPV